MKRKSDDDTDEEEGEESIDNSHQGLTSAVAGRGVPSANDSNDGSGDTTSRSPQASQHQSSVSSGAVSRHDTSVRNLDDNDDTDASSLLPRSSSSMTSPGGSGTVVTAGDRAIIRNNDPRIARIRRGISMTSWVTGVLTGLVISLVGGLPVGTVLLVIVTSVGYFGSELGSAAVIARLNRLEGGRLVAWAENVGDIRILDNVGGRLCLSLFSHSLGSRYRRPMSLANAAQRARIQDRGVEFLALLAAALFGGGGIIRFGVNSQVILDSLLAFTVVMSGGRGYLVAARHGAELHRSALPRILAVPDGAARQARVLLGSMYASTTIGDFFTWLGVIGKPLMRAGFMLPLALLAKILPQSAKGAVLGLVGADLLSEVEEAVISANLLGEGVLPENVENVAEKKTTKYKIFWTLIYSLFPFFMGLIPYLVCHFHYQLGQYMTTEYVVMAFAGWEFGWLVVIGCCFERIDRTVSGVCSACTGACSKDEDRALAAAMVGPHPTAVSGHSSPSPGSGTTTVTIAAADDDGDDDSSGGSSRRNSVDSVSIGNLNRRSSAAAILHQARASMNDAERRVSPPPQSEVRDAPTRVPIDPSAPLDAATVNAVIGGGLRIVKVGTTAQGRIVSVLEPRQTSTQANLQVVIDLNKADQLLFVSDPQDSTNFYMHLSDVAISRGERGTSINLNGVDIAFDRHHGLQLDENAFAAAFEELQMEVIATTSSGRSICVIKPGQHSNNRYVQRLLQLEAGGERHCFIVDYNEKKTAYCELKEIYGTNAPDPICIASRSNRADRVFDEKMVTPPGGVSQRQERQRQVSFDDGAAEASSGSMRTSSSFSVGLRGAEDDDDVTPSRHWGGNSPVNTTSPSPSATHRRRQSQTNDPFRPSAAAVSQEESTVVRSRDVMERSAFNVPPFDPHTGQRHISSPMAAGLGRNHPGYVTNHGQGSGSPYGDEEVVVRRGYHHVSSVDDKEERPYRQGSGIPYGDEGVPSRQNLAVGDGVERLDRALCGVGIPSTFGHQEEVVAQSGWRRVVSAVGGAMRTMGSGVASIGSRLWGTKDKASANREPIASDVVDHRSTAAATTSATVVVPRDDDSDDGFVDCRSDDGDAAGSQQQQGGAPDDKGISSDQDAFEEDVSEDVDNESSNTIEWFYDDRTSLSSGTINVSIFQENAIKTREIKLSIFPKNKMHEKINKEREKARKKHEALWKEIEDRGRVKTEHEEGNDDGDDDDDSEKTIGEKFVEEVNSHNIIPKKYDIPDNITVTPPQTIVYSADQPMYKYDSGFSSGEISQYFRQSPVMPSFDGKTLLFFDENISQYFYKAIVLLSSLISFQHGMQGYSIDDTVQTADVDLGGISLTSSIKVTNFAGFDHVIGGSLAF